MSKELILGIVIFLIIGILPMVLDDICGFCDGSPKIHYCEYCGSKIGDKETNCKNCGAPVKG